MALELRDAVILVLAPHTDDGELGAGAAISRWCGEGNSVHYVAFSACETTQTLEPKEILRAECASATARLGIASQRLRILDFEVRHFDRERQRVLDVMVGLAGEIQPDMVLVPSIDDTHQDHFVVANEARRAFKQTRMLGYEVPWNNFRFETTAFVRITERDLQAKQAALAEFRSQAHRSYMTHEYQEAQVRFRGVQAGVEYAEAFQVLRWYL